MELFKKIFQREWKITEGRAFGVIVFICLAGLTAGMYQISRDIKTPFSKPIVNLPAGFKLPDFSELTKTDAEKRLEAAAELKKTDTDEDGLTNYDELYVYTTSPYLADSDSDGINDQSEIKSGEDPNCPKGQTCGSAYYKPSAQGAIGSQTKVAPDDLRATLQGIGVPQSVLEGLSDEELEQLYQKTVSNTGVDISDLTDESQLVNAPLGENPQEVTIELLKEFNAPEIRELLKGSGLDEETLNQVDDATLEYMYQKSFFGAEGISGASNPNINS